MNLNTKKNKVKISVSRDRTPIAEQIVDLGLRCEIAFIPWIETMLNSVYNLLECNVIDNNRTNKYLMDIAGDRLLTHLAVWNPDSWRAELEKWLDEMKRVLRPNSFIVLFESLGTGNELPIRLPHLEKFYPWLDEVGFQNKWIRTDYKFKSVQEAEFLSRFFFGDELGDKVKNNNWDILPECTGVWWRKI